MEDIADFMNMDNDTRASIVKLGQREMQQVATVCNRYPNIEMSYEIQDNSGGGNGSSSVY